MTEGEVIAFLLIPEVGTAKNHHYVIENLKQMRGLSVIHICNRTLDPLNVVREYVDKRTRDGK